MRGLIVGILVLAVVPAGAAGIEEATNYCHSKDTNQKWEELAAENHGVVAPLLPGNALPKRTGSFRHSPLISAAALRNPKLRPPHLLCSQPPLPNPGPWG